MEFINPTLEWYKSVSAKHNLTPRCPFASSYKCPIYYQSLSLLKDTGATKLDENKDKQLEEYWKKSKLNPILMEEMPGVTTKNKKFTALYNFCPEVTYLRFVYFASHLSEFADEIDKDIRYTELEKRNIDKDDWRWYFQYLTPQHYTDCSYYSILLKNHIDQKSGIDEIELTDLQREDYKKYKYKCYYKINIIGKYEDLRKDNYIEIDGNRLDLGKNSFILFKKLAEELKENMEGCVEIEKFVEEIDLSFTGRHQLIERLRKSLTKLKFIDTDIANKLIENNKNKRNSRNKKGGFYRISNHPDFVTYNKKKLLSHKDPYIRKLAEELPNNDKNNSKIK